jgi:hypothetical protein
MSGSVPVGSLGRTRGLPNGGHPDILSQVTQHVRKPRRRTDTLLAHSVIRAVVADLGGWGKANERYEAGEVKLNAWLGVKATPKASRVAAFIVLWAVAMRLEGVEEYSITEYQRYWHEGERQAYRLQKEFRELWPEFENPNELARQIVKHVDERTSKRDIASLPARLQVSA